MVVGGARGAGDVFSCFWFVVYPVLSCFLFLFFFFVSDLLSYLYVLVFPRNMLPPSYGTPPLLLAYFPVSLPADIKRLMAYAPAMNSEFIVSYFGTLSRETSIDVMKEMLGKNMRQNLQMVVQIATAYSDQIHAESLIQMFESFKLYEGLFYYLGAIVNNSTVRHGWRFVGWGLALGFVRFNDLAAFTPLLNYYVG